MLSKQYLDYIKNGKRRYTEYESVYGEINDRDDNSAVYSRKGDSISRLAEYSNELNKIKNKDVQSTEEIRSKTSSDYHEYNEEYFSELMKEKAESIYTVSIGNDAILFFVSIITTSLKTCKFAESRYNGLMMLVEFSRFCTDEYKLQRIIPYILSLLNKEENYIVKSTVAILFNIGI